MRSFLLMLLLGLSARSYAQSNIAQLVDAEYDAGHFNGTLLVARGGKVVTRINKGMANLQFAVPITNDTRFPIASMTKTFTAILALQLYEKRQLKLTDKAAAYLPDLPTNCQNITIAELLTHYSGLKNETGEAYKAAYSPAEYVSRFAIRDEARKEAGFRYNNVDYVVLTRILEVVAKKPFARLLQDNILTPLRMKNSGLVQASRIIPQLAYGYHNYTFGAGSPKDTLQNDLLVHMANYAGAGAMYSTADDLLKLVQALKANTLLSASITASLLLRPQQPAFLDYARGYSTIGFYYNDKTFPQPILERRGSINGFNSVLLMDPEFRHVVIILTNTDTADLEVLADKVYSAPKW